MYIVKCSQMDSKVTDKMPNNILDYEDIKLTPQKCVLEHRHQAQTSVQLGSYTFQIPVVPANMASVIDEKLAVWLAQNNYFYIMRRFTPQTRFHFVQKMHQQQLYDSISVGVPKADYELIDQLVQAYLTPALITIDIAHGYAPSI